VSDPQPSVGRIVHYVSHGTPVRPDGTQEFASECRAAVITEVDLEPGAPLKIVPDVSLCVLNPSGMFFNRTVPYDEDGGALLRQHHRLPQGGTWHWPERV
jgi:hypothetical protein